MQFVALFGSSVVFVAFVAAGEFSGGLTGALQRFWVISSVCGANGTLKKQKMSNACSVNLSVKYSGSRRACRF